VRRRIRARLEPYTGRLFGYALTLTVDRASAEDLTQETLVKALSARRVPADEPAFRAWLFRIMRNAHIDEARRRHRDTVPLDETDASGNAIDWDFTERVINGVTVRAAMSRLTADHRDIISLIDIAGLSYAEAAAVLQVPTGTIMSRISRARQALMAELSSSNVRPMLRRGQRR